MQHDTDFPVKNEFLSVQFEAIQQPPVRRGSHHDLNKILVTTSCQNLLLAPLGKELARGWGAALAAMPEVIKHSPDY